MWNLSLHQMKVELFLPVPYELFGEANGINRTGHCQSPKASPGI